MRTRNRRTKKPPKCYILPMLSFAFPPFVFYTQKPKHKTWKPKWKRMSRILSKSNSIEMTISGCWENLLYRTDLGVRDDYNEEGWSVDFVCVEQWPNQIHLEIWEWWRLLLCLHFQTRNYNGTSNFVYRIDDIIAILMAAIKKMNFQAIVWNSLWKKGKTRRNTEVYVIFYQYTFVKAEFYWVPQHEHSIKFVKFSDKFS